MARKATALAIATLFAAVCLSLCAFVVDASHFRYATYTWVKKLDATVPVDRYAATVRIDVGGRWSFPWGGTSTCPTSGFTATGTTGAGSCPAVGTTISWGSIVSNKSIFFGTIQSTSVALAARVNTVTPAMDLLYSDFTFDVSFPITSNPVTLTFNGNARISQLAEGNNDINWNEIVILNLAPSAGTKSPASTSLPVLYVTAGVPASYQIPTVAFDNYENRFRFATTAESSLTIAVPGSNTVSVAGNPTADDMTISSTGLVQWTAPPVPASLPSGTLDGTSSYAVQFVITSYDTSVTPAVAKNAIPLDLIFKVSPPISGAPSVSLVTAATTVFFEPGTVKTYTLTASVAPAAALYSVAINRTPLPTQPTSGTGLASFTQPVCSGSTGCVGTFSWGPSIASSSQVTCYQAVATRISDNKQFVSPGMLCVSHLIAAYPTTLVAAASTGICGGPATLSATLTRTIDGSKIVQRTITFTDTVTGAFLCSGQTDVNGVASCTFIPAQPSTGRPFTATFTAIANEFLQSSASQNTVVTTGASATLNAPFVSPVATVGVPLVVQVKVNRVFTDGGVVAPPGTAVTCTLTPGLDGASTNVATGVVSGSGGIASITFGAPTVVSASYSVSCRFAGDTCLAGPATSSVSVFSVFQRVDLSLAAPSPVFCGAPFTLTSSLRTAPNDGPVSSATITYVWSGVAVTGNPTSAVTNAAGSASASPITFSGNGAASVTGSHTPISPNVNSDAVAAADTFTLPITVALATTAFDAISNVPVSMLNANPLTVSTTLSRTVAPAGGLVGVSVTWTLNRLSPALTVTRVVTTGAAGVATVTWTAAELGTVAEYTIGVSFAATTCLAAASASSAIFTATNLPLTQLTINPVSVSCGVAATYSATLTRQTGSTPVAGVVLTFVNVGTGATICATPVTNAAGVGSCTATVSTIQTTTVRVVFAGIAGQLTGTTATTTYSVSIVSTAFTTPSITPNVVMIGGSTTITSTLSSVVAIPIGTLVTFTTIFGQGGSSSVVSSVSTTDNGVATLSYSTFPVRGPYSVTASYTASGACTASSTSAPSSFIAYAKANIVMAAPTAVSCGTTASVSATLSEVVGGAGIVGEVVTFVFTGANAPSAVTATTGANGVATATFTTSAAGSWQVAASFSVSSYYTDSTGTMPPPASVASSPVAFTVNSVAPIIALPVLTPSAVVVGTSFVVSSRITRADSLAVPSGVQINFQFTGPAGTTPFTVSGLTDSTGYAQAQTTLSVRGSWSVTASIVATGCLTAGSSASFAFTAKQNVFIVFSQAAGVCGGPTPLAATFTTLPDNAPVPLGSAVTFQVGAQQCSASTNAVGLASCSLTFSPAATLSATATFAATSTLNANSAVAPVVVGLASTSMTSFSVASVNFVSQTLTATTTLSRVSAPTGVVNGVSVVFTLTGPSPATTVVTLSAVTDANGVARVDFPLNQRGQFHVEASFAATTCLAGVARSADMTVFQKTYLLVNAAHGVCGATTDISAGLLAAPTNTPIAGETVSFNFNGVVASRVGITNAQGTAIVSVAFPSAGQYPATASFASFAEYFVDENGNAVPTTASFTVDIAPAASALEPLTVATTDFVGDNLLSVTALSRVSVPTGNVANAAVLFTLSGPDGVRTQSATSDANGHVQTTFLLAVRGPYTIVASYTGDSCLLATSTPTKALTAYQQIAIAAANAAAVCGTPITLSSTISAVPAGSSASLAGQVITFAASSGLPASASGTTNAAGTASAQFVFSTTGTFPFTTTFDNAADFFANDQRLVAPSTKSAGVTVAGASTAIGAVSLPAVAFVAGQITATATLTRTAMPSGVLAGFTLRFDFAASNGVVESVSAGTGPNGIATATLSTLVKGPYSVTAHFAGSSCLLASASAASTVTVYQKTAVALVPSAGACGAPQSVRAALTAVPQNTPIAGQTISFDFMGVTSSRTATTDGAGEASVDIALPLAGTYSYTASFLNAAAYFVDSTGNQVPSTAFDQLSTATAVTALSAVTAPLSALVGGSVTASGVLSRVTPPAGPVGGPISFTLVDANGNAQTALSQADASTGVAQVTFTSLTVRGLASIDALFTGDGCRVASNAAAQASVPVYEAAVISLQLPASTVYCDQAVSISASLNGVVSGLPVVDGEQIVFDFGGVLPPLAATTVNGVATVSVVFPKAGAVDVHATFADATNFYANRNGAIDIETVQGVTTVVKSDAGFGAWTAPARATVDDQITVATSLARITAPAGPVVGQAVTFAVSGPSPVAPVVATTAADGTVSAHFAFTEKGAYSIAASYTGGDCLIPVTSQVPVIVYQRVNVHTTDANGVCGEPIAVAGSVSLFPSGTALLSGSLGVDFEDAIPDAQLAIGVDHSVVFALPGSYPFTVVFADATNYFTSADTTLVPQPALASAAITVSTVATTLSASPLSAASVDVLSPFPSVTARITRTFGSGIVGVTTSLTFTLARPSPLPAVTYTVTSGADGTATVVIPGTDITLGGAYSLSVAYAGDLCQQPSTLQLGAFTAVQRINLSAAPVSTICGATTSVHATLLFAPQNTPPTEALSILFASVDAIAPCTAVVSQLDGSATCDLTFATRGDHSVTASFDGSNTVYESVSTSLVVSASSAVTSVVLAVPSTGDAATGVVITAAVTRVSPPSTLPPVDAGVSVAFGVTYPDGSRVSLGSSPVVLGVASVTFTAPFGGLFVVDADTAGDKCLAPASAGTKSIDITQRTSLAVNPTAAATCGAAVTFSAVLKLQPQDTFPTSALSVRFVASDNRECTAAVSVVDGTVSCSIVFPVTSADLTVSATFSEPTFESLNVPFPLAVGSAATSLALTAPASNDAATALTVSAKLTRDAAPAGLVGGATISFTLASSTATVTHSATTGADGIAAFTFDAADLPKGGSYVVTARFTGDSCLAPAVLASQSVAVTQQTALHLSSAAATCGSSLSVSATIILLPQNTPSTDIDSVVTFVSSLGATCTATTVAGTAVCNFLFTDAEAVSVDASTSVGTWYLFASASLPVTVGSATSSLVLTTPPHANAANDLTVSALLTRVSAPTAVAADGRSVVFTLTRADGSEAASATASTASGSGVATVTFLAAAIPVGGVYGVHARFAGDECLASTLAEATTVRVTQLTSVVGSASTDVCGEAGVLSATLLLVPQGTPSPVALPVVFTAADGQTCTGLTDTTTGIAVCSLTFSPPGDVAVTAAFQAAGPAFEFYDASTALPINVAVSIIPTVLAITTQLPLPAAANPFTVSIALKRDSSAGAGVASQFVTLSLVVPAGAPAVAPVVLTTDVNGVASHAFAAADLSVAGSYSIDADYDGSTCYDVSSDVEIVAINQVTVLTVSDVTIACRASATLSAKLAFSPQNTPAPAGLSVSIGSGGVYCTGTTNANGVASCVFSFADVAAAPLDAVFNANGYLLASVSATGAVATVTHATSQLTGFIVPATHHAANDLTVAVVLSRTDNTAVTGETVVLTLAGPNGAGAVVSGTVAADGTVSVTFPASALPIGGAYSVTATYAGDLCIDATSTSTVSVAVTQVVTLSVPAVTASAVCGDEHTVSATLLLSPQNVPSPVGLYVTFSDGTNSCTDMTDSAGLATCDITFPGPGSYDVVASFAAADYVSASAHTTITVSRAATTITGLTAPAQLKKDNAIPVTAILSRASGPVVGGSVVFTLTRPGLSAVTVIGTTNSAGLASASFAASVVTATGTYSVSASYTPPPTEICNAASVVAAPVTITVTSGTPQIIVTQLIPGTATATCGAPVTISATLKTIAGVPIAGKTVTFVTCSGTCSGVTNSLGVASCTVTVSSSATSIGVAAYFSAAGYTPSATSFNVAIVRTTTSLTQFTVPAAIIRTQPLTVSAVLSRTSTPTGPLSGQTVRFTLKPNGSGSSVTVSAVTDANGKAVGVFGASSNSCGGLSAGTFTVTASYAGSKCLAAASAGPSTVVISANQATALTAAALTVGCGSAATLSATLRLSPQNTPAPAQLSVRFTASDGQTCNGYTNAQGVATCQRTFSTSVTVTASFSASGYGSSSVAFGVTISSIATSIVYNGKTAVPVGTGATLSARLTVGTAPVSGKTVTLSIGTQSCTGSTDANGVATCQTSSCTSSPALGPRTVKAVFAGQSCYAGSTSQSSVIVFAFPSTGVFAVGDGVSSSATTRTYLASSAAAWFNANPLSRDSTSRTENNLFRGFGKDMRSRVGVSSALPSCGGYVNSDYDDNVASNLPSSVPEYMGVIVVSTAAYDPNTGAGGSGSAIDDCRGKPCRNHAICRSSYGGGYYCDCEDDDANGLWRGKYHGKVCEIKGPKSASSNRGQGCGRRKHGTGHPEDTTTDVVSIIVLKTGTYSRTAGGVGTVVANAVYCP